MHVISNVTFDPAIPMSVETRERTVIDRIITIEGVSFEFNDLHDTLCSVEAGQVYTTFSQERFAILKKYGILEDQGSNRWQVSAKLGPNGAQFIELLDNMLG